MDETNRDLFAIEQLEAELGPPIPSSDGTMVSWDCIGYEAAYTRVMESVARAPETDQKFALHALQRAGEMHLLSRCCAQRTTGNLWHYFHKCIKHLWPQRA